MGFRDVFSYPTKMYQLLDGSTWEIIICVQMCPMCTRRDPCPVCFQRLAWPAWRERKTVMTERGSVGKDPHGEKWGAAVHPRESCPIGTQKDNCDWRVAT